jgi:hypothetical protein
MNCFDLSSFFLLRNDESPNAVNSSSLRVLKTEPLTPITTGIDFAYASNVAENNGQNPVHIIELSF